MNTFKFGAVVGALAVNVAFIPLWLQSAETAAEVKGIFHGRIVDTDGNPVTDAKITLRGPSYVSTAADDEGRFSFVDVKESGEYRVAIESKMCVGITDYRKMPRVVIDVNESQSKNFKLDRAFQVRINVKDEAGDPVTATLYYQPVGAERSRNASRAETDKEGYVVIGGLALDASYIVGARSTEHAYARIFVKGGTSEKIAQQTIVLSKGQSVKGTSICSDGLPPAGWTIRALPAWWNFGVYPAGSEIADDGSFQLDHIGDGTYNLAIHFPIGDRMSTSRSVLSDANLLEMKRPIRVSMNYPSPIGKNYLTGTLKWLGKQLDRAVEISGYCHERREHFSYYIEQGTTTFKVGPVPPGTYRIRVEHPEINVLNLQKNRGFNDLDNVKIPNEKPLLIALRVRGRPEIQGLVTAADTGKPIEKFQFRIAKLRTLSGPNYAQQDSWRIVNSKQGTFSSEVVGPGIYTVSVLAEGYALQSSKQVNTDDQPDGVLKIELVKERSLKGRVVDAEGNAVVGATVRALSLASGAMPRVLNRFVTAQGAVTSDKNGEFELRMLGSDYETVRIDHPQFAFKRFEGIPTAVKKRQDFALSRGATIRGIVFDANGQPQANETLLFQDNYAYGGGDRDAGTFGQAVTGDDGKFEIAHLPSTVVYVSRAEEWNASGVVRQALQVEDGKVHHLNFGGTNRLFGQIESNGQPLRNTRLQLGGTDSTFGAMKMFAATDEQGHFTFFGPPPGVWSLYRSINARNSEWVRIRDVEVPAREDAGLGSIKQNQGTLTVKCTTDAPSLPPNLQLRLWQYDAESVFGRSAAIVSPRQSPDEPFVFQNVSPGDFELVCWYESGMVLQRLKLTNDTVNQNISFHIPVGSAALTIEAKQESGELFEGTLSLWSTDRRFVRTLRSGDADMEPGIFTATGLPPGDYVVRYGNMRNAPVIGKVSIVEGQENNVVVRANPSASNKGRATVFVTDGQGVFVPCKISIDGGKQVETRFRTTGIQVTGPPGKYVMQIDHPGFISVSQEIELKLTQPSGSGFHTESIRLHRLKSP